MEISPNRYKNIHEYLDVVFFQKDPSEQEIVAAKKTYWRAYNRALKKRKRATRSEFTVSLSRSELKQIQERMSKERSVTAYLQKVIIAHLENHESGLPIDTALIEQRLFIIVESLQELCEKDSVDTASITTLITETDSVLTLIEDSFDNKK